MTGEPMPEEVRATLLQLRGALDAAVPAKLLDRNLLIATWRWPMVMRISDRWVDDTNAVIRDQRAHLVPATFHRHPVQLLPQLLQPMQREDWHIRPCRSVEPDPTPYRLHPRGNSRLIRPRHHKAAAMHIEMLARHAATLPSDLDLWQADFLQVLART